MLQNAILGYPECFLFLSLGKLEASLYNLVERYFCLFTEIEPKTSGVIAFHT